jgi:hypothetical protein
MAVSLTLTTQDGNRQVLATAHPDAHSSFTVTTAVPADAPLGPATITDGVGHQIHIRIATGY